MTRAKDISKIITDADFSGTLDVAGTVTAGGLTVEGSTAPTINIKSTDAVVVADDVVGAITFEESDATGGTGVQAFIKAIANDSGSTYDMSIGVGGNTEAIRVDQSGSVGIGLTPNAKLEIDGEIRISDQSADSHLYLRGASGQKAKITLNEFGVSSWEIGAGTKQSNNFTIDYNGNERMRIDSSGNVGIGTSSPTQKLEVSGKGVFSTANPDVNGLKITATTGTNASAMQFTNAVNGYVGLDNSTGGRFGSGNYGLVMYHGSPYPITFHTNATERMRIDSSGNVGIGITSPAQLLHVQAGATGNGTIRVGSAAGLEISHDNSSTTVQRIDSLYRTTNSNANLQLRTGILTVHTGTSSTERMRIDSSGNLLVGCTGLPSGGGGGAGFETGQSNGRTILQLGTTTTSQETLQRFYNPNGNVGEIKTSGSSTSYVTTSDHRLKENVTADWDATTRLKQLNPVRFNFISDADTTVDGFLAHEVQSVVPEAITGTHNEVDEDGNPVYQGIDQSKLVPLLVKTIQELEARITALETA